jgi:predicted RNA-binding Zn-ribbon protein involved in translation (DUF1610 family)
MSVQQCLTCGADTLVQPALFPGEQDTWHCPTCGSSGIIAYRRDVRDEDEES